LPPHHQAFPHLKVKQRAPLPLGGRRVEIRRRWDIPLVPLDWPRSQGSPAIGGATHSAAGPLPETLLDSDTAAPLANDVLASVLGLFLATYLARRSGPIPRHAIRSRGDAGGQRRRRHRSVTAYRHGYDGHSAMVARLSCRTRTDVGLTEHPQVSARYAASYRNAR
jgi:hypothetical protein